jgi:hypothetical protein
MLTILVFTAMLHLFGELAIKFLGRNIFHQLGLEYYSLLQLCENMQQIGIRDIIVIHTDMVSALMKLSVD